MKKILFIVQSAIHDKIGHAGGKTVNYYFSKFVDDSDFVTKMAYLGDTGKDYNLMRQRYSAGNIISFHKNKNIVEKAYDYFRFNGSYPIFKKIIPKYYITNNFLRDRIIKTLQRVESENFYPDVIIAEFTGTIFWVDEIKAIFPKAVMVASCHDVSYLSVQRSVNNNVIFSTNYYLKFKKNELSCLNKYDLVVPHNVKDKSLLEKETAYKHINTHVIAPYFDTYTLDGNIPKCNIVFFGAMGRAENTNAVDWFLKNVWGQLSERLGDAKFIIVGGGLNKSKAKKYLQFKGVELTGFVNNPEAIFSSAFCFVVPLQLGAGIKVKVLEAMSSGIPVVTNDVGIEGIPAKAEIHYIHCSDAYSYSKSITMLFESPTAQQEIVANALTVISQHFNLLESYTKYKMAIIKLVTAKSN